MAQIERTKLFEYGGGAEGKHFWERRADAVWYALTYNEPHVVRAKYIVASARAFFRWPALDGRRPARFADETQMNVGLLELRKVY
jgi:hypothetical protein